MLLLLIFAAPKQMMAQEEMCSTDSNYPNAHYSTSSIPDCNDVDKDPYYLNIVVNLIRQSNGNSDRTLADVYEALDLLQSLFDYHLIYFRLKCIKYIDEDDLYNQSNEMAKVCLGGSTACTYPNFADLFDDEALTIFVYPKGMPTAFGGGMGYVRYAYHYTIGWKSRTRQSTGSVSQRQGCPSRGGI